jgi:hypothetical protein
LRTSAINFIFLRCGLPAASPVIQMNYRVFFWRHAWRWLLFSCVLFPFANVALGQTVSSMPAGQGYVDAVHIDSERRQLTISGWVASLNPSVFVTNLILEAGDTEIYRGHFEGSERPDVALANGRKDWLGSGFRLTVDLPRRIQNGALPIKVSARLGDGSSFELSVPNALKSVSISAPLPPARWRMAVLIVALALPVLVFFASFTPRRLAWPWIGLFGGAIALSFSLLVAGGWTGSSLGLALKGSSIIEHDALPWQGADRWIRSDEWEVLTPLAISQASHRPPYPVVNKLLGTDGQNMMVIGMAGVPVAHISSIAKPATWGFFLFDLRAALSWYWWFPFFACFSALWLVLIRFFELDWRVAAALSLTGSASPYAVVFSAWPAYTIFFPLVALLSLHRIFVQRHFFSTAFFGLLLGWASAGFALILYPSWQISIAYLMLPLAIAWLWSQRNRLNWGLVQFLAVCLGVAVAAGVLFAWWWDARDAVMAIKSTVYPGGRSLETGGDIAPWFLIKGWLGPVTMYINSTMTVASDAGTFPFILWAVLPAVFIRLLVLRRIDAVACALTAVTLFVLVFIFIGFDKQFARMTLLGFATSYRADLVLGTAQIFMLGWLMSPSRQTPGPVTFRWLGVYISIALFAVTYAVHLTDKLPTAISQLVPSGFTFLAFLAIGLTTYWLLIQRYQWVLATLLAWTLSASLPFNPIGQAPNHVNISPSLAREVAALDPTDQSPPIAVVGERIWAMTLPAAGLHVVNTAFYYPQKSIWATLDPGNQNAVVHNRYHRLLIYLKKLPSGPGYVLESPRLDEVRVSVDPDRFDFRLLGAKAVLVSPADGKMIRSNSGLRLLKETDQWALFQVLQ